MSTYTVERLANRGARHAFALLLQHIRSGDEPFVTYGTVARLLETKLRIPRVFPTHVGAVAGTMMDRIEAEDPEAGHSWSANTGPTITADGRFQSGGFRAQLLTSGHPQAPFC